MTQRFKTTIFASMCAALCGLWGCSDDAAPIDGDSGTGGTDSGRVDAGRSDAGPRDSGRNDTGTTPLDSGPGTDSSVAADAGHDAGSTFDAGPDSDGGSPADAGFDAGSDLDAGFDAGEDAGSDAGTDSGPPAPLVPGPGDLVISEISNAVTGSDDEKEWLEIHNPSSTETYELMGCTLEDSGAAPIAIDASLLVGPGDYVVLAGAMADLTSDYTLPSTIFGFSDTADLLTLRCGSPAAAVDTVDWSPAGFPAALDDVTIQLSSDHLDTTGNDAGTSWCSTSVGTTYGTGGALRGSPGAANALCPARPTFATLRVNEVNANITSGCDLMELRVTAGGSLEGVEVRERTSVLLRFPAGFTVATNDLIVVHMNRGNNTCLGGGTSVPADETTAPNAQPAATHPANYDTAFDFWSEDSGLTATDNVFWTRTPFTVVVDAVFTANAATGTAAADSETAAAIVAAQTQWTMVGGGIPVGGFVDDNFRAHAVLDLDGTGSMASGDSIRRTDDADTNTVTGWAQGASTWGAINAGQSAL